MSALELAQLIEYVPSKKIPVSKVILDETNPNKMTHVQLLGLEKFMVKHGFAVELWVNDRGDGTYLCIDGEHRVKVLQKNNIPHVYAKVFSVKPHEVKMMRQIANKLHGEHNKQMDAIEFKNIYDAGKLDEFADVMAQPIEEFQSILEKSFDIQFTKPEEEIPEPPAVPKSKLGDIYQLGNHIVMCGDSTKDVDKLINGITVYLLLTDPPYGISIVNNGKVGISAKLGVAKLRSRDGKDHTGVVGINSVGHARQYRPILNDDKEFDPEYLLQLGITQIIFGANNFSSKLPDSAQWLVWDKKNEVGADHNNFSDVELMWTNTENKSCRIYRHTWSGLIRAGDRKTELKERVHPTQKPVGLLSEIIKDYSKENETVLDCYLGSGSTLIAAEQTNRICYGMELDPRYIDVIVQRWENYTGKKAKKISDHR